MTTKIHFRVGKNGTTACASSGVTKDGMIRRNSRTTYQHMSVVSVGPNEFFATPAADRCSHCCDRFTAVINERHRRLGKPLYKNALTKERA